MRLLLGWLPRKPYRRHDSDLQPCARRAVSERDSGRRERQQMPALPIRALPMRALPRIMAGCLLPDLSHRPRSSSEIRVLEQHGWMYSKIRRGLPPCGSFVRARHDEQPVQCRKSIFSKPSPGCWNAMNNSAWSPALSHSLFNYPACARPQTLFRPFI